MASHVSARIAGRLPARHVVGTRRRNSLSARQLCGYIGHGERDACGRPSAVYDGRTRGIRRCFRTFFCKDFRKRLDGISRSIARGGKRPRGIPSPYGDFPKRCALYGFRCLVADSERFYRFDFTGRARAAHGYGDTRTHAEREE